MTNTTTLEWLRCHLPETCFSERKRIANLIEILPVWFPDASEREKFLRLVLGDCLTDAAIHAFANGRTPVQMVTLPCVVKISRYYRVYLNVPDDASAEEVSRAAVKYVQENGVADTDLDPELDEIEDGDIVCANPDWDGAQYE